MAMNDHTVVEKKSGVWSELVKERTFTGHTVIGLSIMLAISLAITFLSVFVIEEDVFQGDIMRSVVIFAAMAGGAMAFILAITLISTIMNSAWSLLNRIPLVKRAIDSAKRLIGKILGWLTVAFLAVVSIAAVVVGIFAAWYFLPMLPSWVFLLVGILFIASAIKGYEDDARRRTDRIIEAIERNKRNGYE